MKHKSSSNMSVSKEDIVLNLNDIEKTARVCKALSSETRLEILRSLVNHSMTISQLAENFYLPMSSMCLHIKILREAGLIQTYPKPGLHGTQKLCDLITSNVSVDIYSHAQYTLRKPTVYVDMPIGQFSDCQLNPPCGIATPDYYISKDDTPYGFYTPDRVNAAILWLTTGYLEYQFPNESLNQDDILEVEFTFEICSEAPGYNPDWPSDIDIELNHKRVATIRLNGDYGGRRGIYNPSWWPDRNTQYGEYHSLSITSSGSFVDQKKVSSETIDTLGLRDGYRFSFILRCSEDSKYPGGMNLFGKHFGDYNQGIVMKVKYK